MVVHAAGCDKYIASLMRRRLCGKLHNGLSQLLFTGPVCHHGSIASYVADDRDLCLPPPAFDAPAIRFGMQIPEWFGYPTVKKIVEICLFVLTEFTNVADGHTHTHTHTDGHRMTV